ncbi:Rv1355c family protein [Mycobacterium sp. IDR2000157661]|uniref:Rv1355c family protein n=1 Tax=Mycobacterium sp. IDR2000157661 TaxID=2867005 RepID=UPI001EECC88C|nr:Rv1355c family protein [Mycobacterium sp. IDR2000157661]ULE33313.1 Rv1355c family protein [Mycobacterium sp. IDR2000157661]
MRAGTGDQQQYRAIVLEYDDPRLDELRSEPGIDFVDRVDRQRDALRRLLPTPADDVLAEPVRWAYYPWRRTAVSVLGPRAFRRVRLDRNRNLITGAESDALERLHVGVVGLSVGHTIAYALAAQGLCGALRLTDFDDLELSNLNRVPATVLDLDLNKAVVCARRIAELNPYLPVSVMAAGITPETVEEFVDGLDIVVEECDSLDAKVLVREVARSHRVPVLMATSDRGLLDVERFDVEPSRPLLHGLIGDADAGRLRGLQPTDRVPYSLRLVDASQVSDRMAASLIEVGKTLSTWPQLSSEVALNAAAVAEAVRRIGLRQQLPSGRARIDIAELFDRLAEPVLPDEQPLTEEPSTPQPPSNALDAIVTAAGRAPSGGNAQPWRIEAADDSVTIALSTEYATTMDVKFRASAVAVGAAAFNARVAAAAHHLRADVSLQHGDDSVPLTATVRLSPGEDRRLADLYEPMMRRETNRRRGERTPLRPGIVEALEAAAVAEDARLRIISTTDELDSAAEILAAADRIRYLTPRLHAEMFAELRWPSEHSLEAGIDVRSLELPQADMVMLDILKRYEVMEHLAAWDGGTALGEDTDGRVRESTAVGVISVLGRGLPDYARGGAAVESVWIHAQKHGVAVQPVSPPFLYAADGDDLHRLSPRFADRLGDLQYNFRTLVGLGPTETLVLVLRFGYAPPPSVLSRRRAHIRHHGADGLEG